MMQVPGQRSGGFGWQGLHLGFLRLVESGGQDDDGGIRPKVEISGVEVSQRPGTEAGCGPGQVECCPILTGQPPEGSAALCRAIKQPAEFIGSKVPACMTNINLTVEQG
ncbi:MAG: hypothetical protein QM703_25480 [Gemmatales bacterium]